MELKKQFNEREYLQLIELISCEMKSQFVAAQSYIYDATKESYAKYQVLILLRHGEVYDFIWFDRRDILPQITQQTKLSISSALIY